MMIDDIRLFLGENIFQLRISNIDMVKFCRGINIRGSPGRKIVNDHYLMSIGNIQVYHV